MQTHKRDSNSSQRPTMEGPVELNEAEASAVSGGVMCSRDPAVQLVMYMATAGMSVGSRNGAFICWG
jgi:hypothetical protein